MFERTQDQVARCVVTDELVRVASRARIHHHVELRVTVYFQLVFRARNIEKAYQLRVERLIIYPGHRLPIATNRLLLCNSRDRTFSLSRALRARGPRRLCGRRLFGGGLFGGRLRRFLRRSLLLFLKLLDRLAEGLHFFFKLSQLLLEFLDILCWWLRARILR